MKTVRIICIAYNQWRICNGSQEGTDDLHLFLVGITQKFVFRDILLSVLQVK